MTKGGARTFPYLTFGSPAVEGSMGPIRLRTFTVLDFRVAQTRKSPARRIGPGPRFPVPAESGIGDSLFPGQIGNRGFPPRFPAKNREIGGIGNPIS
jgi:hypothetical protein